MEPEPQSVAVAETEETELRDGFYAFTTNDKDECVHMVYNQGIQDSERTTFDTDQNEEISGEVMYHTFSILKKLCKDQEYIPEKFLNMSGEDFEDLSEDEKNEVWAPFSKRPKKPHYGVYYVVSSEIVCLTYGEKYNSKDMNYLILTGPGGKLPEKYNNKNLLYISWIGVKNVHQGNGLCKQLLKFFLLFLIKTQGMKYFAIWNESSSGDIPGLPACYCYVGAALESSLLVFNSVGDPLTSREECTDLVSSDLLVYFFEVNSTDGGGKKRNIKRKKEI